MAKENLATLKPYRDFKPRVRLENRTVPHKDKKKEGRKKACRKNPGKF